METGSQYRTGKKPVILHARDGLEGGHPGYSNRRLASTNVILIAMGLAASVGVGVTASTIGQRHNRSLCADDYIYAAQNASYCADLTRSAVPNVSIDNFQIDHLEREAVAGRPGVTASDSVSEHFAVSAPPSAGRASTAIGRATSGFSVSSGLFGGFGGHGAGHGGGGGS